MIDEGLRHVGTDLAMQRFANYRGHVEWKQHSVYMRVQICILLVAENLNGIKSEIRAVME